jgi:hypothetical protein
MSQAANQEAAPMPAKVVSSTPPKKVRQGCVNGLEKTQLKRNHGGQNPQDWYETCIRPQILALKLESAIPS